MAWSCFYYYRVGKLVAMVGKPDSAKYYAPLLNNKLLPYAVVTMEERWIFQQDNAAIPRSALKRSWFTENNVDVLPWHLHFPDLNPIENLWGIVVRSVYGNGRQFEAFIDLWDCIVQTWESLGDEVLRSLVASIQKRFIEFLQKNGACSKHWSRFFLNFTPIAVEYATMNWRSPLFLTPF